MLVEVPVRVRAIVMTVAVAPALSLLLAACLAGSTTEPERQPVTVQLRWTHQAQFAGFYAAELNGDYEAEGLAVSLAAGGPNVDLQQPLLDGSVQFSVMGAAEMLLARSEGRPLVAIATIYRRSPLVLMAMSDSGITRPQDFAGKRIRVVLDTEPTFRAMMARIGLSDDDYTVVDTEDFEQAFYSGDVDVTVGYVTNEAIAAREAGHEINLIYPGDYGVHFYADTIVTTDELIETNPELVTSFLRATLRGWRWAIENAEAASALGLEYDSDLDPAHELAHMTASVPLIHTGQNHLGWMSSMDWSGMQRALLDQGVLDEPVVLEDAFTLDFLEAVYGG